MRTNTPLSELQQNVLRYLLERDSAGALHETKDRDDRRQRPGGFIPWSPAAFFGRTPTSSERVALSKSLEALENRGLISRRGFVGKGKRTTHVLFSYHGRLLAEALSDDHPVFSSEDWKNDADRHRLEKTQAGLEAALDILNEMFKAGTREQQAKAAEGGTTVTELLWVVREQLKNTRD